MLVLSEFARIAVGHAPGLRGDAVLKCMGTGIATDHEIGDREEARERLTRAMQI